MQTAIQLFTLRAIDEPLSDTIARVAETAFDGVELIGLPDDADAAAAALEECALTAASVHLSAETIDQHFGSALRCCDALDCADVAIPYLGESHFSSRDAVEETAAFLAETAEQFDDHGLRLHYHNHGHEFADFGGESAFEVLIEETPPIVNLELDVGWAAAAGADPLRLLEELGDRCPLVHVKDVAYDANAPAEIGEGDVELPECVRKAGEVGAEWAIYEHDEPSSPERSLETGSERLSAYVERT